MGGGLLGSLWVKLPPVKPQNLTKLDPKQTQPATPQNKPPPGDTYKAACNVWSRYRSIMSNHADIVAASRAAFYHGGSINITAEARPRMARLHAVNQVLTAAQLRLDGQAMLFSDLVSQAAMAAQRG